MSAGESRPPLSLGPIGTSFCGAPATTDLSNAQAAVMGIGFDAGTHPTRIGSRLGPNAIREQSGLVMPFDPRTGTDLVAASGLVDLGDVPVVSGDVFDSFPRAEAAVRRVVSAGVVPIVMGGDGLITLPVLRACGRSNPGLGVVHLDAHTDSYPGRGFTTAHTFTRAVEEKRIDPARSVHIGLRGTTYDGEAWSHARDLGFHLITMDDWAAGSNQWIVDRALEIVDDGPAHLSFDMDVFDPSVAPGVCTPAWGGIDASSGLEVVRRLAGGRDWTGFDLQTVSPPHDVGGITALLAATVMLTFVGGLVERRG